MQQGPFRIEKPAAIAVQSAPGEAFKDYMNRLITLIPGEALGAYLTIRGFWVGAENGVVAAPPQVQYLPLLGLALVLVARIWGTRDSSGSAATVQWTGTVLAAVAFLLWVLAMGHGIAGYTMDGRMAATLIVVFSFGVPYLYKGE